MSTVNNLLQKIIDAVTHHGEQSRAELAAGFRETVGAVRLSAARPVPVAGVRRLSTSAVRLSGWSLTADTASTVYLRNGQSDDAELVAVVVIAGGVSSNHWFAGAGVAVAESLWIQTTGGTVTGTVFLGGV